MRVHRRLLPLLLGAALVAGVTVPLALPGPATALPCLRCQDDDPGPTPTPSPPTVTTLYALSPNFGWSGDTMAITGVNLANAAVTFASAPATIVSNTTSRIVVTVPALTTTVVGPLVVTVTVSTPKGTTTAPYTASPTLQASAYSTFGSNGSNENDGYAGSTITVDRSSGFVHGSSTAVNYQAWLTLTVNASAVWLDGTGRVIGFTSPVPVAPPGLFFAWPSSESRRTATWTGIMEPNPGVASQIRSGRVLLARDHGAELLSTLQNAVATGKAIAEVIQALMAVGALLA
jgi:hypothetical protein